MEKCVNIQNTQWSQNTPDSPARRAMSGNSSRSASAWVLHVFACSSGWKTGPAFAARFLQKGIPEKRCRDQWNRRALVAVRERMRHCISRVDKCTATSYNASDAGRWVVLPSARQCRRGEVPSQPQRHFRKSQRQRCTDSRGVCTPDRRR